MRRIVGALVVTTLVASGAAGASGRYPLTGPAQGEPAAIAGAWLASHGEDLGFVAGDLTELEATDRYVSDGTGITHIWMQQHVDGVPVEWALIGIHVLPDGAILTVGDRLQRNLRSRLGPSAPALTPEQAVDQAALHLGYGPVDRSGVFEVERRGGPRGRTSWASS